MPREGGETHGGGVSARAATAGVVERALGEGRLSYFDFEVGELTLDQSPRCKLQEIAIRQCREQLPFGVLCVANSQ